MSNPLSVRERANISGYLRENPYTPVTNDTLMALRGLRTPSVAERANTLLRHLARIEPTAGSGILVAHSTAFEKAKAVAESRINTGRSNPDEETEVRTALSQLAIAWASDFGEFSYLLDTYLGDHCGFVKVVQSRSFRVITPKGWDFLQNAPDHQGRVAFVAMWFAPEMAVVFLEAIRPGIEDAGYIAFRVDQKEHNDDITDEILAGIQTCKFMVADFTGHRGGVYYEAGFAAGLGKQVIKSVRADHAEKMHFDIRQLSHIRWSKDDLPAFRKALTARIVGSIGRGPLLKTA